MLALQIWIGTPLGAWAAALSVPSRQIESNAMSPTVVVNRHVPESAPPPPVAPTFSGAPTEADIFRSGIFVEPLVPAGRQPSAGDNRALAAALTRYAKRTQPEDVSALQNYLEEQPDSPWRMAVLVNLGILHCHACRFSQTFPAWEEAWRLGGDATDLRVKALADRALGELIRMNARVGRMDRLEVLFLELGDRTLTGAATEMVAGARQGLWRMKNEPWQSFRCGPLALDRLMAFENPAYSMQDCVYHSRSTTNGFSLQQVWELSQQLGLKMQSAKRSIGASVLVPSVVNWKVGHYAALVKEEGGRFLVQDSTFGQDLWVSKETLEQESSGYFLIKAGPLPKGWAAVSGTEAETVFGKGDTTNKDPNGPIPDDLQEPKNSCQKGMATYAGKLLSVSLHLQDIPVGYRPPRGPAIEFTVDYNQREQNQPSIFTVSNFGSKWTFNWLSYVTDAPDNPSANATVYLPGGGQSIFTGFSVTNNISTPETRSRAVLSRTSSSSYSLLFTDGSKHIFARAVGPVNSRRVFLTQIADPAGNVVDLFYDGSNRISAVRDSLGQVSTLTYGFSADSFKITRITDPFGRFAAFDYDAQGRLTNITDTVGIHSAFGYQGTSDFIGSLTTPYGTSRFRHGQDGAPVLLEMTDPEGATERIEFRNQAPGLGFTDTTGVPQGIREPFNQYIWSRNTFFWDKKAFSEAAGDYTKATIYHWLHDVNPGVASGILESQKLPLENRVWRNYPGQTFAGSVNAGMQGQPSRLARLMDDGATELYQYEYNALGNVTKTVDPVGRTTSYAYSTNLIDLLEVRQTAGVNDLLQSRTYNSQHLPLTVADGSGRTNRFTYNAAGQILTATNPRNDVTTFGYDTNGYLLTLDGPLPGTNDTARFTYDGYGHLRTVTDTEGYTLTYDYDALDRLTRTTYPDGTFEENTWSRLDRVSFRDRMGRLTQYTYDGNRRLTAVEDPLHRITGYDWCSCGQLSGLVDAMGRTTRWHRDLQGRVTAKEYVDGSQVQYAYERSSSRLKSILDEKGQIKLYDYWLDGNLRKITYLNAEKPTPNVSFTYDKPYNRVLTMQDGIGTTLYGYHPANTNGGALAFVDGPLANDTVTYDYDELGRVSTRSINGAAYRNTFDALGRVTAVTNVLGAFNYAYVNATDRPASVLYPNGQRTDYHYYDNLGDQRLEEIKHTLPANVPLSKFNYAYNQAGQITNWLQQAGTSQPDNHRFGYDAADQLLSSAVEVGGTLQKTNAYAYDPAGNRLLEQASGTNRLFTYNALNEITSLTDDPVPKERTLEWDAENRLVAVSQGNHRSEFAYDGLGRWVRIAEKENGVGTSDRRLLWCGDSVCEERNPSNGTVTKRFFGQGEQSGGVPLLYDRDHLGSVRGLSDGSGEERGRFSFNDYGIPSRISGNQDASFGFTGHYIHQPTGLHLTRFRAYDNQLARWLSRDPIGEEDDQNLFAYVKNNPVNWVDPLGLLTCEQKINRTAATLVLVGGVLILVPVPIPHTKAAGIVAELLAGALVNQQERICNICRGASSAVSTDTINKLSK
jgi:RHS repeat-associated protein